MEQKTFAEAIEDLRAAFREALEPPLLSILRWLDRQLRRFPRLYAYLSR